jgi:Xaa-Pro dipeptidase
MHDIEAATPQTFGRCDMDTERIARLQEAASDRGLDCIALVPGANLYYLTGLSFHLSERPVVAFLPVDAAPAIVLPGLEAPKLDKIPLDILAFPYTDEEGPALAFHQACASLELAEVHIGVEELQMRVMEARYLERYAPNCELVTADDVMSQLRVYKDAEELTLMQQAAEVIEAALHATVDQIRAGMTEQVVAERLMIEIYEAGGEGIAFSPIVVAGPNAASPHSGPSDRAIRAGETIVIDCGAMVGGYVSDITRTFAIKHLPDELIEIYEAVKDANAAGRDAVKPGVEAQEVDRVTRAVIEDAGYGEYFIHRTGHGLGLEVHEHPYIVEGNQEELQPGMTFTGEPGIYLSGKGGVRIEDDVVVTPRGGESLTAFPRELQII